MRISRAQELCLQKVGFLATRGGIVSDDEGEYTSEAGGVKNAEIERRYLHIQWLAL